jgi:DeoR family glycerol-3-phosphate regulon repressor
VNQYWRNYYRSQSEFTKIDVDFPITTIREGIKEAAMKQQLRKDRILEILEETGFVSIDELVELFDVTPQTVRRDLNQLADSGHLVRHHGGAGIESSTQNTAYNTRQTQGTSAKNAIAKMVARDIPDGSSLFINIGTTTEAIARELLQKEALKVVTNNLHVASILSQREDFQVIIAGGEVRHSDGGIIGEATVDLIRQFQMDFAIIGISGIQADGTLLDFDYREVKVAQAIIANSRRVMLCTDSSKFGRSAMVRLGTLEQIDDLYTDDCPGGEYPELIKSYGVQLHCPQSS